MILWIVKMYDKVGSIWTDKNIKRISRIWIYMRLIIESNE